MTKKPLQSFVLQGLHLCLEPGEHVVREKGIIKSPKDRGNNHAALGE